MFQSSGHLEYTKNINYSLRVVIDPEISRYYRFLLPKYLKPKKQFYDPHISVVRKESPIHLEFWGKYEGKEVEFHYDNVEWNDTYVWVNVYSLELENIRTELGLRVYSNPNYTMPPDGYNHRYHFSIGNFKES